MAIAINTEMKVVTKPWGEENWLQLNDRYCFKRIVMKAGHRSSLQHHEKKHETNFIVSGKVALEIQNGDGEMETWHLGPGDLFTVPPPRIHRVNALTDIVMLEVSTPEVDDVVRHADDAGRGDGRIESEHQK
jgi:mannose-6-phosphate isomerase